jgi:hypothetical protein
MLNSQLGPFASREQILRTPNVQRPQQHHQTTSMSDTVRAAATSVGGGPNSMPNAPSPYPQMPQPDYSEPTLPRIHPTLQYGGTWYQNRRHLLPLRHLPVTQKFGHVVAWSEDQKLF